MDYQCQLAILSALLLNLALANPVPNFNDSFIVNPGPEPEVDPTENENDMKIATPDGVVSHGDVLLCPSHNRLA